MLCSMIVRTYCTHDQLNTPFIRSFPFLLKGIRYSVYIGVGMGIFAIIGTRLHYTLDVLIAIFVVVHSWTLYHWVAIHPRLGNRLLSWLESHDISIIDASAYRGARRTSSSLEPYLPDPKKKKDT